MRGYFFPFNYSATQAPQLISPNRTVRQALSRLYRVILLPAFAAALLLAMWAAVVYQLGQERAGALREAVGASQSLARTLADHTGNILRQTEHATQLFKLQFEESGGTLRLNEFTRRGGLLDSVLPSRLDLPIALIGADGNITDSVNAFIPDDMTDAAFFRAHAANPADIPLFGTPVLEQRTKKWLIRSTRRLNGPGGRFAGVIVMMIDPAHFIDDYDRLNIDAAGALLLLTRDSSLSVGRAGERLILSDKIGFTKPSAPPAPPDQLLIRQPFDRIARIYSYREMPRYGLLAVVGVAESTAMALFERRRSMYRNAAGVATLLIVAVVAMLMQQSRRLRRSMRAASEAQGMLRAASQGSLDAVFLFKAWRPDGRGGAVEDFLIADLNERAADMLGKPRADVLGRKACQLLPILRQPCFFGQYMTVLESGVPLEDEFEVRLASGATRWLHHQIVAIEDGVAVTTRDISARKRDELETRNNRAFLQSLIEHLPVLVYVKSARPESFGRMVVWNRAAENVTGYAAAEVIGKSDSEAFPPDLGLHDAADDRRLVAGRSAIDWPDKVLRRPDGTLRHLHTVTVPLFDQHEQAEYILCIAEDVTLHLRDLTVLRESETALLESEARLRTIADALPAMIAYVDAELVYRFHNIAYEREFSQTGQHVLGQTVRDTVGEAHYRRLEPYLARVLAGETLSFEEDEDSDGGERCLEVNYIPQYGENGDSVVGFHVMRQDITMQRREKRRLLKLAQHDALTGLTNRAGFLQKLSDAMQHCRESHSLMAVMYMDIDRFKPVNDTHGHGVGDALLRAFAARLTHTMRASDTIARLGGDEFTIIMEKIARPEDAAVLAAKIVAAMRAPFELDGSSVAISASIGLAFYRDEELSPAALLKQADVLLYQAKQGGRDTFRAAALAA